MNHCVNCKHFIEFGSKAEFGLCQLSPRSLDDLDNDRSVLDWRVTGVPAEARLYQFATICRHSSMPCGLNGKLFEPTPPLVPILQPPLKPVPLSFRQKFHNFIGKLLCLPK